MSRTYCSFFALLFGAAILLTGCDSGDPIDEPSPQDVAGSYDFTEFRFVPSNRNIPAYSFLDTLVAGETYLRLLSSGEFVLFYEYESGNTMAASGSFTVRATTVTLRAAENDVDEFAAIALDPEITLNRVETDTALVLSASLSKTLNLSEFSGSEDYADLPPLPGSLEITVVHR